MHTSTEILTSMLNQFLPLEQDCSFIQYIPHEKLGQPMGNMNGTLDHHWNTIVLLNVKYHQPIPSRMLTQSSYFLPILLSHLSHHIVISISQQQKILTSFKSNHQLHHHWNMATEPKINLSK